MNEAVILPEMLEAGTEALTEAKQKQFSPHETVVTIYLAMRAIEEIASMRRRYEAVH